MTWTTSEGQKLEISEMTDRHILNAMRKLSSYGRTKLYDKFNMLKAEAISRNLDISGIEAPSPPYQRDFFGSWLRTLGSGGW